MVSLGDNARVQPCPHGNLFARISDLGNHNYRNLFPEEIAEVHNLNFSEPCVTRRVTMSLSEGFSSTLG